MRLQDARAEAIPAYLFWRGKNDGQPASEIVVEQKEGILNFALTSIHFDACDFGCGTGRFCLQASAGYNLATQQAIEFIDGWNRIQLWKWRT